MLYATPDLDERELEVLNQIEGLKHELRHHLREPRRWSGPLRRQTFARAVQGSNSIEGYVAKLDDAAAIAEGAEPLDADEETRLAIKGYSDAMTYVIQLARHDDFSYSTQLIKGIHFMMTSYSLDNRPGDWRRGDIYVRDDRTGDVVYEGPPVEKLSALMAELSDRLGQENGCADLVVVRAAMAHLNLVMIHPFRDGNGRMARCLQSLVLARDGILSPIFMNVEEYLSRNTPAYYEVLAKVGQGRWKPDGDTRPWLRFMLIAHLRQARTLARRIDESGRLWIELDRLAARHKLHERMLTALFDAVMGLRVRNSTYRAALKRSGEGTIAEITASKDLRQLSDAGLLEPRGANRGRFYVGTGELIGLRRAIVESRDPRDDSDPFEGGTR
ncbi:Fic family protein [Actinomadura alba]|uniref:Fic family protein n=1 Tax=Actinomadura alba TaxID=406431 RepID=A0ABR7LPZ3_9ACTN|nr:Fic family protein [Actinomadura alba]MBC6466922.1 Fic family protein [Actinomadura alba]